MINTMLITIFSLGPGCLDLSILLVVLVLGAGGCTTAQRELCAWGCIESVIPQVRIAFWLAHLIMKHCLQAKLRALPHQPKPSTLNRKP